MPREKPFWTCQALRRSDWEHGAALVDLELCRVHITLRSIATAFGHLFMGYRCSWLLTMTNEKTGRFKSNMAFIPASIQLH
jgi:hypothetical protein